MNAIITLEDLAAGEDDIMKASVQEMICATWGDFEALANGLLVAHHVAGAHPAL